MKMTEEELHLMLREEFDLDNNPYVPPEEDRHEPLEALCGKNNAFYGQKHTEETRKLIGQRPYGPSPLLKAEHRCDWTGRKHTEESKKKMRESTLGQKWSEESRKKVSDSQKNNPDISRRNTESANKAWKHRSKENLFKRREGVPRTPSGRIDYRKLERMNADRQRSKEPT